MEAQSHLSAELVRRFLDQRVSKDERKAVVRHLITRCEQCLPMVTRLTAESGHWFGREAAAAFAKQDYTSAFDAALKFGSREARRIADERLVGWGHWSALEPLPPHERLAVVVERREYQHWGLFYSLLEAARSYSFREPREAADIAQLALDVVEILSPAQVGGHAAAHDMQARAFAILANSRRLASDLPGARQALAEAWSHNERGAGDALDRAEIYSFDASYVRQVGEFETAEVILEKVLSIYQAAGDAHLQGRTLIKMGTTIGYIHPDKGIEHIQRGLPLINAVREPRLELCAQHGLAWLLTDAGRPQQALAVLDRARSLYKQFPDVWTQHRLHWIQGKIARGLNHLSEAVSIFKAVRDEFDAEGLHQEYLMVSIDLAEAHAAAGELPAAAHLLDQAIPILASWNLHRNALAAWMSFLKILQEGQDLERRTLFARVRLYYNRHWYVPGVEFTR